MSIDKNLDEQIEKAFKVRQKALLKKRRAKYKRRKLRRRGIRLVQDYCN